MRAKSIVILGSVTLVLLALAFSSLSPNADAAVVNDEALVTAKRTNSARASRRAPQSLPRVTPRRSRVIMASDAAPDVDSAAFTSSPEAAVEHTEEVEAQRLEAYSDTLTGVLEDEPRDGEWSRVAEAQARDVIESEQLGSGEVLEAECRTSMCRVTFRHESPEQQALALDSLPQIPPLDTEGFVHVDAQSGEVEVFFAREGYELPQLEGFS